MMGALADLGRKLEDIVTAPETGIGQIIKEWTEETLQLLKQEAPKGSGALANSFEPSYEFQQGLFIVKFLANDYWDFINSGVDGYEQGGKAKTNAAGGTYSFKSEAVSTEFINSLSGSGGLGWIASKGLSAEDGDYQGLAWAIAKSIKKKGIKADGYIERVFSDERLTDLEDRIVNFIQNKINE